MNLPKYKKKSRFRFLELLDRTLSELKVPAASVGTRSLDLSELEERVLLSAAPAAMVAPAQMAQTVDVALLNPSVGAQSATSDLPAIGDPVLGDSVASVEAGPGDVGLNGVEEQSLLAELDEVLADVDQELVVDGVGGNSIDGNSADGSWLSAAESEPSGVNSQPVATFARTWESEPAPYVLANVATGETTGTTTRHELVFVDPTVANSDKLLDDLWAHQDSSRQIEIVLLSGSRDGVEQISETLADRTDLDAIHFVTHGTDRAVKLGSTWLQLDNLSAYSGQIAQWGGALTSNGDLLFYGCELAKGPAGQELLESIQSLTGADIAASTNNTGSAILGGDWNLEFHRGAIDTQEILSGDETNWDALLNTFVVTNTADSGAGSLRQAILDANSLAGLDTISFSITGSGLHTITLTMALPTITDAVVIDGYSQTGSQQNTLNVGSDAVLTIELDGNSLNTAGLTLGAGSSGSTIRGLSIVNFDGGANGNGILVLSNNNIIAGSYVGLRADGITALGNSSDGIQINGAMGNTIGGSSAADRNVISGSTANDGVQIFNGAASNTVRNNYIGTDKTGTLDRGNFDDGIDLDTNADNNQIIGNLISGNNSDGIDIGDSATDSGSNVIQGNLIGTQANGTSALANTGHGILVGNGATANNTTIGGNNVGEGNTIAFNGGDGVYVVASTGVSIRGNSIHSNTGLGIDLGTNGVTANDLADGDSGANSLQNFPVLFIASSTGGNTTISGSLNSTASTTFRIELFSTPSGDSSGYGEGQTYLGTTTVTTDTVGNAAFSVTLAGVSVATGQSVSATATVDLGGGNYGGTSEFAANLLTNSSAQVGAGQDTYIMLKSPDDVNNFGAAASLVIDRESGDLQRALLLFNLSAIPTNATITSATLNLQATAIDGTLNISVYEMLRAWNEGSGNGTADTANWTQSAPATNWTSAGGDFNSTAVANLNTNSTGQHAWNLTTLVQAWVDGTKTNNGLMVASPDGGGNRTATYDSSEGATPPQLVISYTVPANAAPTLDNTKSPALTAVSEDASAPVGAVGTLVSALVDFASPAGQVDNVTDLDGSALLGIAVTAADTTNGTWHYSTNGGTNWNALGVVANASARLLAADANTRLYFQPNADYNGTLASAITFRAWDQTSGSNGTLADTSTNGGATAFSLVTDTASLVVNPVNDAPTLSAGTGFIGINEDDVTNIGRLVSVFASLSGDVDAGALQGVAVVSVDNTNGTWQYTLDGSNWFAIGNVSTSSARLLPSDSVSRIRFVPNADWNGATGLTLMQAWDQTSGTAGSLADVTVNGGTTAFSVSAAGGNIVVAAVNDAPVVTIPVSQSLNEDGTLTFSSGNGNQISVNDIDAASGSLLLTLSMTNGSLTLNGTAGLTLVSGGSGTSAMQYTGTLTNLNAALNGMFYTPTANFNGAAGLGISIGDQGNTGSGGSLSDTEGLGITVNPVNDAPTATNLSFAETYTEDTLLNLTDIVISDVDSASVTATLTLSNAAAGALNTATSGTVTSTYNSGSGIWSASGALADVNTLLAGLTFTPASNFNSSFTIATSASDGVAAPVTGSKAMNGTAVNDEPVITSNGGGASASVNVAENNSAVTTVTSTDVDGGVPVYSISGGADAAKFNIVGSTGVLTFSTAPNFESPTDAGGNNVYDVQVTVNDGTGLTDSQDIAVTVTAVNDNNPVITSNGGGATASVSMAENTTAVTTVVATDADLPAQTLMYSISGGADAAKFSIVGSTGVLTFVSAPNFEAPTDVGSNNVYDVQVAVSDGAGLTDLQDIAVTVTAVNDNSPVITSNGGGASASINVAENTTAVTTVTATDADLPSQTMTYSISGGVDAAKFAIVGSTGALSFVSAPNFESPTDVGGDNVYDVQVTVSDGAGLTDVQDIAVTVTAVNDNNPVITSNGGGATAAINVAENSTAVTTVVATDADLPAQTLTYSISGGADAAKFTIVGSTGVLTFVSAPNFESPTDVGGNNVYDVQVTVSDGGGGTDTQDIAITVTAVNDNNPVITSNSGGATASVNVAENSTAVTTVTATDADLPAQTLNFSISGGADSANFTINSSTGALTFVSAPNFEAPTDVGGNNVYDVIVQASDGTLTDSQAIAVTVTAVNDNNPVIASNGGGATASVSIAENATAVTTVIATDADLPAQTMTYSISGGADSAKFSINSSSGALIFVSAPNREAPTDAGANNIYDVQVQVSDGAGRTDTQNIAITINDVDEFNVGAISDTNGSADAVNENAANGTVVGMTAFASDADATNNTIAYSLDVSAGGRFVIDSSTGVVTVADGTLLNREAAASHGITVRATSTDGSFSTQTFTITINDVDEFNVGAVTDSNGAANAVNENAANGTTVGSTASASDADATTNAITYSLDVNAGGRFAINSSTGIVTVADGTLLDREAAASHNIVVRATSADASFTTQSFTINLNPLNDNNPIITSNGAGATAAINVRENSTAVTTVTATDADLPAQTLTYSITGGADAAKFSIVGATGVLSFVSAPNFEAATDVGGNNVYDVHVTASDGAGLTDMQAIAVTVTDLRVDIDNQTSGSTTGSSLTLSHTTAGDNRLMLVAVSMGNPGGDSVTEITYNGDSLIFVGIETYFVDSVNEAQVELWQLVAPDLGTHNVVITLSGGTSYGTVAGVMTFSGVDQTTPLGAFASAGGNSANPTVNISSGADELVFAAMTVEYPNNYSLVPEPGQTQRWDLNFGSANSGASTEAGAASVAMSWSFGDSNQWVIGGVSIKPTQPTNAPSTITSNGGGDTVNLNLAENVTAVTTVTASDTDLPAQSLTYDIAGGDDAARFTINTTTGALSFVAAPDRESATDADGDHIYEVMVQVSDGLGGGDTQAINVTVTDVDEFNVGAISDTDGATNSVDENAANGTLVGLTAFASDADATTNTITYTLDVSAGGRFAIDGVTGVVTVANGVLLNREAAASHGITVRATSADGSFSTRVFTITLNDLDEFDVGAITDNNGAANAVNENAANGTVVGVTALASDADATTNTITYSLDINAGGRFTIDGSTGVVTVANSSLLDYETNTSHSITVRATSADTSFSTQAFTIAINPVNDNNPIITSNGGGASATTSIAENTTAVTTVTATDADLPAQTLTSAISGGADAALFTINSSSGALSFLSAPDFESPTDVGGNNVYDVQVTVSDGAGLTDSQDIAVTVTAVNDNNPVITSNGGGASATTSIAENATAVTTVTATDADLPVQTLSFTISGGADALKFTINSNTGVLTFVSAPDFETPTDAGGNNVYDVQVTVSDGAGLTDSQDIAVTVTAVNDNNPIITSNGGGAAAATSIAENSTSVTTVTATDADLPVQTLTFSISGGADAAKFTINSSSGALSFVSVPDFETPTDVGGNNVYDVTVQVSDGAGLTDSQAIAVTITAVNEAPVNAVPGAQSTNEDTALVFSSGNGNQISIADVDVGAGAMQVTLTGTNGTVSLNGTSGLTFSMGDGTADATMTFTGTRTDINTALNGLSWTPTTDFNGAASLAITTNDQGNSGSGGALSDTDTVSITVNAVNDAPVNTVTPEQSTNLNTSLVLSTANGNSISVSDLEAGSNPVRVTLTETNGTLTLSRTTGLTFTTGDGTADATMTFTGTQANINAALDGLVFAPTTGFTGTSTLQVTTNDLGSSGAGGAQSTTDSVMIEVVVENRVNTTIGGNQVDPSVAIDADGDHVVVWASDNQDGNGKGIYAQRYDATGAAVGGEFRVNTTTAGDQVRSAVSMDSNGNFIVTWASNNQDGDKYGIYGQRFNAAGVAQGGEFLINVTTTGQQDQPAVAMDANGDFVIAWKSDSGGTSNDIYARRYNSSGVAQGGEFRVNSNVADTQDQPAVAMGANGSFVVTWKTNSKTDGSGKGVFAQRYDSTGVAQGGEFQVNTTSSGDQEKPTVAMTTSGDFVIAWKSGQNQDGDKGGIFAQRFNAAGVAQGSEFRVNTTTIENQDRPTIGIDGTGAFTIAWASNMQDGNGKGIFAQRYLANGTASGGEFRLNSTTSNNQDAPALAMSSIGDLIVAWQGNGAGDTSGVFDQYFRSTNDAPQNSVPGAQATNEDTTLVFSSGNGNSLPISDVDALSKSLQVILSVTNGTLTLSGTSGLTFSAGDGTTDATMTFTGTTSSINTALNGLSFAPTTNFNGSAGLSIVTNDQGNSGGGGALSDTDAVTITVNAVNDAPVLDNSGVMTLTTINEDNTNPAGNTVASIIASAGGDRVTDVDSSAVEGIAITSLSSGNGTWQFSTDGGGSWSNVGVVSSASSLLLRDTDRLRLVPDGQNATSATVTFRAWDQTSGSAGTKVDTSTNGGTTPFSSATELAGITVTAVNDAPVLDNSGTMTLTTITEDNINNSGDAVFTIIASAGGDRITDVDNFPFEGFAITGLASGNGTWQYSVTGGVSWNNVGSVSDTSALLLRDTDRLRFVPDGQNADSANVTFRAWDQSSGAAGTKVDASTNGGTTPFSLATESASITVTAVNDAPVLDNSGAMSLTTITEDDTTNAGDSIAAIVGSAGGDRITDVDTSAAEGIAVTGLTSGNGTWQFSTDGGGSWSNVGVVSDASVLLLRDIDRLRFVPDAMNSDAATVSFRAWDQTTGTFAMKVDASTNGGTTAFSTATESASISVTAINDAPVAIVPGLQITNEDLSLVFSAGTGNRVSVNDVDANGGDLLIALTSTNGTLTLSTIAGLTFTTGSGANDTAMKFTGTLSAINISLNGMLFTPDPNVFGIAGFDINVNDQGNSGAGTALNETQSVAIQVNEVNDAPVAVNDSLNTNEDVSVSGNVLTNDTDIDNTDGIPGNEDTHTAVLDSGPTNGSVLFNSDGSFTYTPNADFWGTDTFTYHAVDSDGAPSNVATVAITVGEINDAPIAFANSYSVNEDFTLGVLPVAGVLANDTDPDNTDGLPGNEDTLTAVLDSGPANGSLTLNSDGGFAYTPNADYFGTDSFTYHAVDSDNAPSNIVTVTITVNEINDAPVANDDTAVTNEDTPVSGNVLTNDTDIDNTDGRPGNEDTHTASLVSGPANGSLIFNSDGSFTYSPNADFWGTDNFAYQTTDSRGALSNVATVTITVNEVNDAPVANADAATTNEDTPVSGNVLTNDTDIDNTDGLIGNEDTHVAVLDAGPTNGSLILNSDGSFTYTPDPDYFGFDSFTYHAVDSRGLPSNIATVTLTVNSINDAPVNGVPGSQTTDEDVLLVFSATNGNLIAISDVDVFSGNVGVRLIATNGTLTLSTTTGLVFATGSGTADYDMAFAGTLADVNAALNGLTFFPDANYNGPASVQIITGDLGNSGAGGQLIDDDTIAITINPVNDAPTAGNEAYSTNEDTPLTIALPGVLANDNDIDFDPLTSILVSGPTHGTLTLNLDGSFTYTPNADYNGLDAFTYRDFDGNLSSNVATVTLTINAVNDAPRSQADAYSVSQFATLTVLPPGVLGNDLDVEGDTMTVVLVSGPTNGTLTLNADGSVTYTPAGTFYGLDSFTYQATDGLAAGNIVTVMITVNPAAPSGGGTSGGGTSGGSDSGGTGGPGLTPPGPTTTTPSVTSIDPGAAHQTNTPGSSSGIVIPSSPPVILVMLANVSSDHLRELDWNHNASFLTKSRTQPPSLPTSDAEIATDEQSSLTFVLHDGLLWNGLDDFREKLNDLTNADKFTRNLVVGTTATVGSSLTVGYVLWLLRGGSLLASFVSTLPAWSLIDPLPILENSVLPVSTKDDEEDDSLYALINRSKRR